MKAEMAVVLELESVYSLVGYSLDCSGKVVVGWDFTLLFFSTTIVRLSLHIPSMTGQISDENT